MSNIRFETAQGKYLAVEVPEGYRYEYSRVLLKIKPKNMRSETKTGMVYVIGNGHTIVGIAGKLGEGECRRIVQQINLKSWNNYEYGNQQGATVQTTAKQSFNTLLRSHNIPSSALIIKIEE